MKTIEQRRLEFLEETVKFYSEDPSRRAIHPSGCAYKAPNGNKCAIGRHIPDEKYNKSLEGRFANSPSILCRLPEEIAELGGNFLNKVQTLHDNFRYWNESGLTEEGKAFVNELKNQYKTTT